jgi:hypothetical protein
MKHLILVTALISATVLAEEPKTTIVKKDLICGETKAMIEHIMTTYGEIPVVGATATDSKYVIMYNKKEHSWTLFQFNKDVACIVGLGDDVFFKDPDAL